MARKIVLTGLFLVLAAGIARPEVAYDEKAKLWTLRTGPAEYRLRQIADGSVLLEYFGPAERAKAVPGGQPVRWRSRDMNGTAEGQSLTPGGLTLSSQDIRPLQPGADELTLVFQHKFIPLEIAVKLAAWDDTGVLTRKVSVRNKGDRKLRVDSLPSLSLRLPGGEYELEYLWGGWGRERQLVKEELRAGRRSFVSRYGRSTNGQSPWFCLRNKALDARWLGQLAGSGNWEMHFELYPDHRPLQEVEMSLDLGIRFDGGAGLVLPPGESFEAPVAAFTASVGDLDDAANQLHRFQRRFVIPRSAANSPPLVQFNSWYPFPGRMAAEEMKKYADAAAEIGAEVFVLDAGWFNKKSWSREVGDWKADPTAFPQGLEELSERVRGKGMRFGLWVEIENLGVDSEMLQQHPDWCLPFNGKPLQRNSRSQLDFSKPEASLWALEVVGGLAKRCNLGWLKIDYNIDISEFFDPAGERSGDRLHRHLIAYYRWLDDLRAVHPDLVIENCSSGGLRFDLGIMGHAHTTWISDEVLPLPSLQLAHGATVEFIPEVCNHWMVGESHQGVVDLKKPAGWWDFMLRVPMNGQFGISSKVLDWSPELKARAAAAVALYKRIRPVIAGADVYHLTPQPSHDDPTGWMAIQYAAQDRKRSVLLAYRLAKGAAEETFRLRGLDPALGYRIREEGAEKGSVAGGKLASEGLRIRLDEELRAAVVEIDAEK